MFTHNASPTTPNTVIFLNNCQLLSAQNNHSCQSKANISLMLNRRWHLRDKNEMPRFYMVDFAGNWTPISTMAINLKYMYLKYVYSITYCKADNFMRIFFVCGCWGRKYVYTRNLEWDICISCLSNMQFDRWISQRLSMYVIHGTHTHTVSCTACFFLFFAIP